MKTFNLAFAAALFFSPTLFANTASLPILLKGEVRVMELFNKSSAPVEIFEDRRERSGKSDIINLYDVKQVNKDWRCYVKTEQSKEELRAWNFGGQRPPPDHYCMGRIEVDSADYTATNENSVNIRITQSSFDLYSMSNAEEVRFEHIRERKNKSPIINVYLSKQINPNWTCFSLHKQSFKEALSFAFGGRHLASDSYCEGTITVD